MMSAVIAGWLEPHRHHPDPRALAVGLRLQVLASLDVEEASIAGSVVLYRPARSPAVLRRRVLLGIAAWSLARTEHEPGDVAVLAALVADRLPRLGLARVVSGATRGDEVA